MPLYITVSEGARADKARPIMVVSDRRIVALLMGAIGRLGDHATPGELHSEGAPRDENNAGQTGNLVTLRGGR